MYCKCFENRKLKDAVKDIWEEIVEFAKEPSYDELSDIAYGINRLVGSLMKKKYIRIFPDKLHVEKINKRFEEYGCIRSRSKAVRH